MRFTTVVSIVFILHIRWVCGDSNAAVLSQSTEKSVVVEKVPEIHGNHGDDTKNVSIKPSLVLNKLLQQNQNEQTQQSSTEDEIVASNENYSGESVPYNAATYRSIRAAPKLQEKLPAEVRTFAHNGGLSGCSCFCPSRSYAPEPIYPAPPPPVPYYAPPPALYAPPSPQALYAPQPFTPPLHYPPPAAYAYARNAPESDDGELNDSMTEEARFRSDYAEQPAYSAPPPYAAPPQTYPSPAPNAKCGQNLLVSCAPTVANVPCSASAY